MTGFVGMTGAGSSETIEAVNNLYTHNSSYFIEWVPSNIEEKK